MFVGLLELGRVDCIGSFCSLGVNVMLKLGDTYFRTQLSLDKVASAFLGSWQKLKASIILITLYYKN